MAAVDANRASELAKKLSALRTEDYFRERVARADVPRALRVLERAGGDTPPVAGDDAD